MLLSYPAAIYDVLTAHAHQMLLLTFLRKNSIMRFLGVKNGCRVPCEVLDECFCMLEQEKDVKKRRSTQAPPAAPIRTLPPLAPAIFPFQSVRHQPPAHVHRNPFPSSSW